jgi:hypothetical protein
VAFNFPTLQKQHLTKSSSGIEQRNSKRLLNSQHPKRHKAVSEELNISTSYPSLKLTTQLIAICSATIVRSKLGIRMNRLVAQAP